jgi:hypothetical protein
MNEEKLAASALAELLDTKGCPVGAAPLQDFIDRIVRCDRVLAVIAVRDGAQAGLNAKKVAQDLDEVAKGDDEASKGHCANAIEHYRNAWRHALQLQVKVAVDAKGGVRVQFIANNSQSYLIEVSTDLLNWAPLGMCTADSDGNVEFTDANAAGQAARFYRAVEQ